ncbi:MAG TPA: amino acid racemase [Brevundimonas sp.]|uniref:aspartate/glutamate racemase family protein n=1 Tax=Brevundimonas sp. TaxID=1871086 RepID=UPI002B828704|nr:amino acid racemase [Brevundimonas sp.]HRH19322.1 amino acid racemase [Brevundimonas sp.]
MKILGVLGGMGPAATIDFLAKLQDATPAERDEDHIRVVMDLNPRVPNRHLETEAAGETLAAMAVALKVAGAQILAMPCNTAHVNRTAIEARSGLELIDMLDAAVDAARDEGARRIGVLSTPLARGLYAERLRIANLSGVALSPLGQEALMEAIFAVKAGDLSEQVADVMAAAAAELVQGGAEVIIAGCSEVPIMLDPDRVAVPLVDATEALAMACVVACR